MRAKTRGRFVVASACMALAALPAGTGCFDTGGCYDIECPSYVRATFTNDLGRGIHDVAARVCFDGSCNTSDGVLYKKAPPVSQPPLEIDLEPEHVQVTLDLAGIEFDKATPHLIVVELAIDEEDPVVLERDVKLIGQELQGRGCGYCWHALLSSERDRIEG